MLLHFYKNRINFEFTEALYWRCYISIYLVSFIVLLQFVGAIEALLLAWMLVDLLGFALVILFAFGFIINALSAKIYEKFGQRI